MKKTNYAARKVFTTGQIAKICKVAPRTVSKWFDAGHLAGYRIPGPKGQGDRRVLRENLIRFLNDFGFPLNEVTESGDSVVLLVGVDPVTAARLQSCLPENIIAKAAPTVFEAGVIAERTEASTIIIDLSIGRTEAIQIATNLRRNPSHGKAILIALANEDEPSVDQLATVGFRDVFRKPFDAALVAAQITTLRR